MKIGIVCYPTFGGSGVVATELGKALAKEGHQIHFITYSPPARQFSLQEGIYQQCNGKHHEHRDWNGNVSAGQAFQHRIPEEHFLTGIFRANS